MAGGVGDYLNKKHPQHGGNENDAPVTRQELQQRKAAAKGLKVSGLKSGPRSHSISSSGVPSRDAFNGPARADSPLAMQQAAAHNGFATQSRNQINGQEQAYAQIESLWAESTMGSDSLETVRDGSFSHYNDGNDHELEDNQGQHIDQDAELSDQRYDSGAEEEESDQNNAPYQQNYNANPRHPGTNQTTIPVRGTHTNRFGGGSQVQQQQQLQLPHVMETVLSNGKRAANGVGQNYGRLGHQVQEDGDQQPDVDTFAPSEVDEDTMHSIADNGRKHHRHASSKRQADDISNIDFDRETLFSMPYEELKKQPFDEDPSQTKSPVTPSLTGLPKTLDERMELFKSQTPADRAAFLATLSIDEWEEAGEWLMKQFGTVMGKAADARRERRKIAAEFEDRLAARDAEVREKADGVTVAVKNLKNGGQNLLRGRTPT